MAEERVEDLVQELRNFRTRSAAGRRLAAMGKEAVGPLLKALDGETQEGAKWAILNCLGEIGAEEALPAIAPYLDRDDFRTVAHEALVKITGRDLGQVPDGWLRWVGEERETEKEASAAPPGALSDDELLHQGTEAAGATVEKEADDRYAVSLPVGEGRRREVTVVFGATDHEGSPIVIIYANCAEADAIHYEKVLRDNLRMPYGAVALRDIGGEPHFVMFNTILREGLSPTELRKSIMAIGERADRVQRELA